MFLDFYKNKRIDKGNSLVELVDDYTVLDLETTGYMESVDVIIEVAAIRIRNGKEVARYHALINQLIPNDPNSHLDPFIVEYTGITDNMLLECGLPCETVMSCVREFMGDDIIVAHNAHFDINFLYDTFKRHLNISLCNNFIDTLRLSRRVFKDFPNHKLTTLVSQFGIKQPVAHRALPDCLSVFACYEYMKKYISDNNIDYSLKKRHSNSKLLASEIAVTVNEFNEEHPLFGRACVFTGTLEKMPRREAMQLVVNVGGTVQDNVTKTTNYLVLGNFDYCSTIKNGKSSKHKKAEGLIAAGADLQIIPENVFYDMVLEV